MIWSAFAFALTALAAAVVGYGGSGAVASEIARVLFFVFALAAAMSIVAALARNYTVANSGGKREHH